MDLNELKQKIDVFQTLNKELNALGKCDSSNDSSGRGYFQYGLRGLMEIVKAYSLPVEIERHDGSIYPYKIVSHDLKAYAISTVSEMLTYGVIETTEGFECFSPSEKIEFAELKAKLMSLEAENRRLKEQIADNEDEE